eukprot:jgi/Mesvir1/21831/Mv04216-RA.1
MNLQLRILLRLALIVHVAAGIWTQLAAAHDVDVSDPKTFSGPLFCPCTNRELLSFTLLMHYRDAGTSTTVGALLRAGVRQAARDRGLRVSEYVPVDFFRASEATRFLENEIREGTAGIIITLCNDLLLSLLAAANKVGIPIYIIGGPDPELYQGLQNREPSTGPMQASIRHIGPNMAQVAATLASRLMSQGITHLECITTEVGELSWHAQCIRLVAAFEAAGRVASAQHLHSGLAFDLANYALDMATRLADVPDREVAVVVADTTLYRMLRSSLVLTAKAGTSVVVYETSPEVLADVRAGASVVALDFEFYAQGYLGLSLAATEGHTAQMVTSDIATSVTIYGGGDNSSQVTDAIMQREVCRAARYPVCGDPGVVPVTPTGCPCFNRSEVAYKVIGLLPSRHVPFSYTLWQGMADAQRDLPGSTFKWDIPEQVDFDANIADYMGVAASDTWRGVISLDPMLTDVPPIVGAMRAVPAAGMRLYLAGVHMAGPEGAVLSTFGAQSFVGVNAFTSGAVCTHAAVHAGLWHLVVSNVLPFFSWTWALVRGMMEGFLGVEFPFPPGLWEGDVAGKSDEGNRTGVYELFVAPETNRTAQAINGLSPRGFVYGLKRHLQTAAPAPDAVAIHVVDEFITPATLAMLDELARSQPGRPPVQLVTQKCFHPEMLALLRRGQVQGEQLLLGCMDEQPYLMTYLSALLAALEQHTGERVVGEVSTARFLQASQLPLHFIRRAACELAGMQEGYEKGQLGKFYPLCDARQGCIQGGSPNATVCSGHGMCVFPTHPASNETTRGAAGACECERGYTGEYCEKRESDKAGWLDTHRLGAALVIVLAVIVGVVLLLGIGLPIYFLWFRKGKGHGSDVVEEFLRKRSPPQKGDVITAVITDIEGSTELWEWNPDVMKRALAIHHTVLRAFLPKYYGYESDTAGDSFSLVFHDAADALGWAMEVQHALLFPTLALASEELLSSPGGRRTSVSRLNSFSSTRSDLAQSDWPQELLSFSLGREEPCSGLETPMYRGLRVRMGMHIGVAEECTSHANGRQHYHGEVMEVAKAIADVGVSGGQVLMSMPAWQSLGQPPLFVSCQHLGLHEVCEKLDPIHLMQVVSDDLAKRVPFRPLKSKQLSPSFFDAPCSDCYVKGIPPAQPVVIAFIYVSHAKALRRHFTYQPAISLLVSLVQQLVPQYEGYECEEKDGNFLLAFASPVMAARMAEALQRKAMELPWPEQLLELEKAAEVTKPAGEGDKEDVDKDAVVFRGLRLQIGLCMGVPVECHPHRATGRAAYYGPIVNRAARIAATAAAGQTLCNDVLYDSIEAFSSDLVFKELGKFDLKGVREPMHLFQVSSPALSARLFPRVLKLAHQASLLHQLPGRQSEDSTCNNNSLHGSSTRMRRTLSLMAMEPVEGAPLLSEENSPCYSNIMRLAPGGIPGRVTTVMESHDHHPKLSFMQTKVEEQVRAEFAHCSHDDLLRVIARQRVDMQRMQLQGAAARPGEDTPTMVFDISACDLYLHAASRGPQAKYVG